MALGLLFVLKYVVMSGGSGPSQQNDDGSRSRLKCRRNDGESSLSVSYLRDKKDLSFDSFTVRSGTHEQSLELQDFNVVDGFLGCLVA